MGWWRSFGVHELDTAEGTARDRLRLRAGTKRATCSSVLAYACRTSLARSLPKSIRILGTYIDLQRFHRDDPICLVHRIANSMATWHNLEDHAGREWCGHDEYRQHKSKNEGKGSIRLCVKE